jgi:HPt (histidine-containing phosphotransfer) domain-containing protein
MNFDRFCGDFDLDRETGIEMLELFYETSVSDLARIELGLKEGSAEGVKEGAHSIKGAARNLGIESIQRIAGNLEEKSRGNVLDGTHAAMAALRSKLELLHVRIRENELDHLDDI